MNAPRLIDVSHVVEQGMITYKGFPAPVICDFLSREASRKIYAAELPLSSLANLDGVVVRTGGPTAISMAIPT